MITREMAETPIGTLHFEVARGALVRLGFGQRRGHAHSDGGDAKFADEVEQAIRAWLEGDLGALDGIAVAPQGTAFQRRVWDALTRIPPATTTTYGASARAIGAPHAARAVGAANGANPIALAVPCHRVVGKGGTLTGYAFGVERKRWLLDHERRNIRALRVSSM